MKISPTQYKHGNILVDSDGLDERWREYFCDLFNVEDDGVEHRGHEIEYPDLISSTGTLLRF